MKVAPFLRCVAALLSILTANHPLQAAVFEKERATQAPSDDPGRSQSQAGDAKKGAAHIACTYAIYLTLKWTIETCYPNKYSALSTHIDKWIGIMRAYANHNALSEKDKFGSAEEKRGFEIFRNSLSSATCKGAEGFVQNFSKILLDRPEEVEKSLKELLNAADDPTKKYGCL